MLKKKEAINLRVGSGCEGVARVYLERDRGRKGNGECGTLLLQLKTFLKGSFSYILRVNE